MGLLQIGAHGKHAAVAELGMSHLQLCFYTGNQRPILAPVKLEGFPGGKAQRNVGLLVSLQGRLYLLAPPVLGEGSHSVIRTGVPQWNQITV